MREPLGICGVVLAWCLGVVFPAVAAMKLQIRHVDASRLPLIKVFHILEKDGKMLRKPDLRGFSVLIDGKMSSAPISVAPLGEKDKAVAVMVLIEASRSLPSDRLAMVQRALGVLAYKKGRDDLVGLISYGDEVRILAGISDDAGSFLIAAGEILPLGGKVALFDAVLKALDQLKDPELPIMRYVIVAGAGQDSGSKASLVAVADKALGMSIPVIGLGISSRPQQALSGDLAQLARKTGGEYRQAYDLQEVLSAYARVTGKMKKQSVLILKQDTLQAVKEHELVLTFKGPAGETASSTVRFTLPRARRMISWAPDWVVVTGVFGLALILGILVFFKVKGRESSGRQAVAGKSTMSIKPGEAEVLDLPGEGSRFFLTDLTTGTETLLKEGKTTLGAYPDNDLVLDDPTVSGRHAEVIGAGESWTILDLGSTNGTMLNGAVLSGPAPLLPRDEIHLGRVVLKFMGKVSQAER